MLTKKEQMYQESKKRNIKGLSSNPGTAILQALDDLQTVEQKKETYIVNMDVWHSPFSNVCWVCLAGAVIACRDAAGPQELLTPNDFRQENFLLALDDFRRGLWHIGIGAWLKRYSGEHKAQVDSLNLPYVPSFHTDPVGFRFALTKGAKILQKAWPHLQLLAKA